MVMIRLLSLVPETLMDGTESFILFYILGAHHDKTVLGWVVLWIYFVDLHKGTGL